jgi:hypothetical protein
MTQHIGKSAGNDDGLGGVSGGVPPGERPIRRWQYLQRFGPHDPNPMLATVEIVRAADGSERKRVTYSRWPGL